MAATAAAAVRLQAPKRVGSRLLCGLIAGRAIFRVILYGANVALLAGWGPERYGHYAAASGALICLLGLAQAGPEKAALKLIPRAREGQFAMLGGLRTLIRGAPIVAFLAAASLTAINASGTVALYAAAAAQSVALGLNIAAVAMQRALGRTIRDPVGFALLSVAWVALTTLAVSAALEPSIYLLSLSAITMIVSEITMRGTPVSHAGTARTQRSSARRSLAQTAALMGVYDVAGAAAGSVAFLVLPFTGYANQAGALYLAFTGWAFAASLFIYVARVFQPRLSIWLASDGAVTGRRQARTLALWALRLNGVWLVATGLVIVAADLRRLPPGGGAAVILTTLLLSRGVIWCLTFASVSLLENSDLKALGTVAKGAAAGFVLVAIASAALIPSFGAAGAVWAVSTDELALAAVVLWRSGSGARLTARARECHASGKAGRQKNQGRQEAR